MATLRKVYLEGVEIAEAEGGIVDFKVNNVWKYRDFTVEAVFDNLVYPEGENDAELKLQDSENDSLYEDVLNALSKVEDGVYRTKIRVVDLHTRHVKVVLDAGSLTSGKLEGVYVTFGTETNN